MCHSPIIGGFVAQDKTWRWTQWCQIFVTMAATLVALPMKETFKPVILRKRAKKLGLTPPPELATGPDLKMVVVLKVIRPLHMLCVEVNETSSSIQGQSLTTSAANCASFLPLHVLRVRCSLFILRRLPLHLPTPALQLHHLPVRACLHLDWHRHPTRRLHGHHRRPHHVSTALP